jgi:GH15 family glucan-1,4-alpha-glucosidase
MSQLDYSVIGNCQISAILDKQARIVWCCMPRFDSPAVFAALLGNEETGIWSLTPAEPFECRQRYVRNTNVVLTEFHLQNGDRFDVYDFAPRFVEGGGFYRPAAIVRIIRPVRGSPRLSMNLSPRFDYGRVPADLSFGTEGAVYRGADAQLVLETNIPSSYLKEGRAFELSGERHCVLSFGAPILKKTSFSCGELLDRSVAYWRTWVKHCNIPFEYQDVVIRSALALKLHIFEDTGAIIASTTTSIPESPDGGRCWDYRYCWLRDAYFVIHALNRLGQFEEMERFLEYLRNIAASEPAAELQPVYGIGGEKELTERELPWLPGFRGYGPVRIGNAAYAHSQYDVYGEMVMAIAPIFFDRRLDWVDLSGPFESIVRLVGQAIHVFDKPDAGIWEFRSGLRHYVFSKVMCWAAVDRGIRIASKMGKLQKYHHWIDIRDRMRHQIEFEGWSEEAGCYAQTLGGRDPDAANLLMGWTHFHGPDNRKFRRMVDTYERLLLVDGYLFRYKNQDDFGLPRHAFTICTFWMVDALALLRRTTEARSIFERVLASANHVGLLSEDVDPASGEMWGNFPQTYSHVGVINSAFLLSKNWGEVF